MTDISSVGHAMPEHRLVSKPFLSLVVLREKMFLLQTCTEFYVEL